MENESGSHSDPHHKHLHIEDLAPQRPLILEKLPGYFLLFCLVMTFIWFFQILEPFLTVIFVSAVLSICSFPLYKKIRKLFRKFDGTASFVTCLLVILITVVPLIIFSILMAGEAVNTYHMIQLKVNSGVFDKYLQWQNGGLFYDLNEKAKIVVNLGNIDVKKTVVDMAQSLSAFLVAQVGVLVRSISTVFLNLFIMLFSMFYFFKDGEKIVAKIKAISPLPAIYEGELFEKIASMSKAIVLGVFLTAILQGAVGGIGFALVGISNPVFWAAAISFFSLVPLFGTALIWVPAVIILFVLGQVGAAIFLLLWGTFVIGIVDNIARPYLIGGKAHTYPLLTFFVVLGGILTMGLQGVIIGPLILMLLVSFLHIYQAEYSKVLKK